MSFLDVQIIREDKKNYRFCLPQTNFKWSLHIVRAFYHLRISLILPTPSYIDTSGYAKVSLNYTLNYFF